MTITTDVQFKDGVLIPLERLPASLPSRMRVTLHVPAGSQEDAIRAVRETAAMRIVLPPGVGEAIMNDPESIAGIK